MPNKILIIGGGFAGFWAAVAARRVAGPRAEVTLLSPAPMLEIRPRLYEAKPETLGVDMRPHLATLGIGFVRGEAVALDAAAKIVTPAIGDNLAYDRLIVATGSRMRRPPVLGAAAAFSVDNQAAAIAFDQRLAEIARGVATPTIAVVGAGFTGIELALELRDRLKVHGADEAAERARIVLIDRAETIGPELGPGPRPAIEAALAVAGVERRLGVTVQWLGGEPRQLRRRQRSRGRRRGAGDRHGGRAFRGANSRRAGSARPRRRRCGAQSPRGAGYLRGRRRRCGRYRRWSPHAAILPACGTARPRRGRERGARSVGLDACSLRATALRYLPRSRSRRGGHHPGLDRHVEKTGGEGKAVKRLINTQVIYPPADGTAEALLAASSIDLAARARSIEDAKGKAA